MNEVTKHMIGRGGLFRIPELPIDEGRLGPEDFLDFFRQAWIINSDSPSTESWRIGLADNDAINEAASAVQVVVPPTAEKPVAVLMDYTYTPTHKNTFNVQVPAQELYVISHTSAEARRLEEHLRLEYYKDELIIGTECYMRQPTASDSTWLIKNDSTPESGTTLTSYDLEYLGELAIGFVELVSE